MNWHNLTEDQQDDMIADYLDLLPARQAKELLQQFQDNRDSIDVQRITLAKLAAKDSGYDY